MPPMPYAIQSLTLDVLDFLVLGWSTTGYAHNELRQCLYIKHIKRPFTIDYTFSAVHVRMGDEGRRTSPATDT